jgi:hypothetical protein
MSNKKLNIRIEEFDAARTLPGYQQQLWAVRDVPVPTEPPYERGEVITGDHDRRHSGPDRKVFGSHLATDLGQAVELARRAGVILDRPLLCIPTHQKWGLFTPRLVGSSTHRSNWTTYPTPG